jgi:hypothetical protein
VRLEIVEFMRFIAPCALSELAKQMDRPADALYHHVKRLLAVGVVVQRGYRKSGRQTEAIYDLSAEQLDFDFDPRSGKNANPYKRMVAATLRMADRAVRAAVDGDEPVLNDGFRKSLIIRGDTTWLTEDAVNQINDLLREIDQIVDQGRIKGKGRLFNLTTVLVPVVRTRHADDDEDDRAKRNGNGKVKKRK